MMLSETIESPPFHHSRDKMTGYDLPLNGINREFNQAPLLSPTSEHKRRTKKKSSYIKSSPRRDHQQSEDTQFQNDMKKEGTTPRKHKFTSSQDFPQQEKNENTKESLIDSKYSNHVKSPRVSSTAGSSNITHSKDTKSSGITQNSTHSVKESKYDAKNLPYSILNDIKSENEGKHGEMSDEDITNADEISNLRRKSSSKIRRRISRSAKGILSQKNLKDSTETSNNRYNVDGKANNNIIDANDIIVNTTPLNKSEHVKHKYERNSHHYTKEVEEDVEHLPNLLVEKKLSQSDNCKLLKLEPDNEEMKNALSSQSVSNSPREIEENFEKCIQMLGELQQIVGKIDFDNLGKDEKEQFIKMQKSLAENLLDSEDCDDDNENNNKKTKMNESCGNMRKFLIINKDRLGFKKKNSRISESYQNGGESDDKESDGKDGSLEDLKVDLKTLRETETSHLPGQIIETASLELQKKEDVNPEEKKPVHNVFISEIKKHYVSQPENRHEDEKRFDALNISPVISPKKEKEPLEKRLSRLEQNSVKYAMNNAISQQQQQMVVITEGIGEDRMTIFSELSPRFNLKKMSEPSRYSSKTDSPSPPLVFEIKIPEIQQQQQVQTLTKIKKPKDPRIYKSSSDLISINSDDSNLDYDGGSRRQSSYSPHKDEEKEKERKREENVFVQYKNVNKDQKEETSVIKNDETAEKNTNSIGEFSFQEVTGENIKLASSSSIKKSTNEETGGIAGKRYSSTGGLILSPSNSGKIAQPKQKIQINESIGNKSNEEQDLLLSLVSKKYGVRPKSIELANRPSSPLLGLMNGNETEFKKGEEKLMRILEKGDNSQKKKKNSDPKNSETKILNANDSVSSTTNNEQVEKEKHLLSKQSSKKSFKKTSIEDILSCITKKDVNFHEVIGYGASGIVKRVSFMGLTMACKVYPVQSLSNEMKNKIIAEFNLIYSLKHESVINYMSIDIENKDNFYIFMEYFPSSLKKIIESKVEKGQTHFNVNLLISFSKQIIKSIQFLHSENTLHRDLKSENIFAHYNNEDESQTILKLGDFGDSKKLKNYPTNNRFTTNVGTMEFMAPELYHKNQDKKKTENFFPNEERKKVDIWSFGLIIFEMTTLDIPYRANYPNRFQIIQELIDGNRPPLDLNFVAKLDKNGDKILWLEVIKLYEMCTARGPNDRPNPKEILKIIENLSLKK